MKILSPIPPGSGAFVLHRQLAERIPAYRVRPYSAWWSLFPLALPAFSTGRADLIHASADYGMFFKRPGLPLVVTVHGYVSDQFMRPYCSKLQYLHYRTDLRWFTAGALKVADAVVANSRFTADVIEKDLGHVSRIRVIHNGVDEARFRPAASTLRDHTGPFKVLFCGNLRKAKRAGLLAPLANRLGAGFEVCYTGDPVPESLLGGSSARGAARLTSLGTIAHQDMPELFQRMDLLFSPSVREGFGLCVAEAMACGLPVVAVQGSALPELVDDNAGGLLCPADDVEAFADAIRTIAESPHRASEMGQYNRVRVERDFTLSRMAGQYSGLFASLVSNHEQVGGNE